MTDLQLLNALYIDTVRSLPEDVLVEVFGLSIDMIHTLKEIPVGDLAKITECNQLLLKPNEAVLCQLLKQSPLK